MKATRFGAAKREPSSRSSKTKSGTVRSARAAAASAGLSWTRRSRLKRMTAVFTSPMVTTRWTDRPLRKGRDRGANASTATSASCCRSCASPSPGVQVLFAFLLAVPFQQNFTKISALREERLLRDAAPDGDLGGAADRALGLPPAHLPLPAEAPPRLPLQPLRDRRHRHPGAGDDLRDHADHRRPLRRRRDGRTGASPCRCSRCSGACCRCGGGSSYRARAGRCPIRPKTTELALVAARRGRAAPAPSARSISRSPSQTSIFYAPAGP